MVRTLLAAAGFALIFVSPSAAGSISLRWDPVAGATGYVIYLGTNPGTYTHALEVPGRNEAQIDGLADCTTHYVAVRAFNRFGESEHFSNEVSGWPRPEIQAYTPTTVVQGGQYEMNISGANFSGAAEIEVNVVDADGNPLVHVDSVDVVSCNQIQALITVEPSARGFRAMKVGSHAITIHNPDAVFGAASFEVVFDPTRLDINRTDSSTQDRVDGKDLVWLAHAHGSCQGEARYYPDADLNGDGFVDGEDLAYLATGFGACWDGTRWVAEGCQ